VVLAGSCVLQLRLMLSLQPDDKKNKYHQLKDLNEHLLKQLESGQQELDQLNMKKTELEEVSCVDQAAGRLTLLGFHLQKH